jgi:hypothetical protein
VVGDAGGIPLVRAALARVPTPVRWYTVTHVGIEATGFDCRAWTGPPFAARPIVTRITDKTDLRCALHEFAHNWHRRPVVAPCPDAAQWAAVESLARQLGGAVWAEHRADEWLADALADCWLSP